MTPSDSPSWRTDDRSDKRHRGMVNMLLKRVCVVTSGLVLVMAVYKQTIILNLDWCWSRLWSAQCFWDAICMDCQICTLMHKALWTSERDFKKISSRWRTVSTPLSGIKSPSTTLCYATLHSALLMRRDVPNTAGRSSTSTTTAPIWKTDLHLNWLPFDSWFISLMHFTSVDMPICIQIHRAQSTFYFYFFSKVRFLH